MNYIKTLYFIIAIILISSCSKPQQQLDYALDFAGENRDELEKVLKYYEGNSLKHAAAEFLIKNMPYHWSYKSDLLDTYREELGQIMRSQHMNGEQAIDSLTKKYGDLQVMNMEKTYDSKVISADFLIENIESSFEAWKKYPWGKEISFEQFCEEILPYRTGHEPLENWRKQYAEYFKIVNDSIKQLKSPTILEASNIIYNVMEKKPWTFFQSNPLPQMGAANLLEDRIGNCEDKSDLAVYTMRTFGIPCGKDFILQYPNRMLGHYWSYLRAENNKIVEFELYAQRPGAKPEFPWKKGRIYRERYGLQAESLPMLHQNTYIPPSLTNAFISDVTADYITGTEVSIPLNKKDIADNQIVYICTFNNIDWFPIHWSVTKDNHIHLKNIESGIVYLAVLFNEKTYTPVSYPFYINENGKTIFLKPQENTEKKMTIHRKYPIQPWWSWVIDRSIGGKFQFSNDPNFHTDVHTVFTVPEKMDMLWHKFDAKIKDKFRYMRYLSADSGFCNMAEIIVRDNKQKILQGTPIGTTGSFEDNPKLTRNAVFDGDPLTYFDALIPDTSWVGLDFGSKVHISEIEYLFRNDDNSIRIGDLYELVYWDNKWVSLKKETAASSDFTVDSFPKNALFRLRNLKRGAEERIFIYKDGVQIWF